MSRDTTLPVVSMHIAICLWLAIIIFLFITILQEKSSAGIS
jgi:hypothetical protein